MRITFIGHASILIEANGVRILSDPWWNGPCFGAQWWPYPVPYVQAIQGLPIDYVYISHGHHDHFHPPTLKLFQGAKVLVAAGSELSGSIRDLGFEVIESDGSTNTELRNRVRCRIMRTYADDTLLAVSDGRETCINLNDALHAAPQAVQEKFCRLLRQFYGRPDYVFCGYGTASHFPNCYVIPGKDPSRTAAMRQAYFNRVWARIVHELEPRFGFPFAADVAFLEDDLFWCNEPVHNAERPTEVFEKQFAGSKEIRVLDIAPGFVIDNSSIVQGSMRQRLADADVRRAYGDAIGRVNRIAPVDRQTVHELREMLAHNISKAEVYFGGYEGDYRCLVQIKGASAGIRVVKTGRSVTADTVMDAAEGSQSYDVSYRTRASYLRQSLATPYGHETLFVGSGGIFEFADRSKIRRAVHRELMTMLRPIDAHAVRRPTGASSLGIAKRVLKRLLGISREDLYDLEKWTIFAKSADK